MHTRVILDQSQSFVVRQPCVLHLQGSQSITITLRPFENIGDECYIIAHTAQPHTVVFESLASDGHGGFLKSITFDGAIASTIALKQYGDLRVIDMKGIEKKVYATAEEIRALRG